MRMRDGAFRVGRRLVVSSVSEKDVHHGRRDDTDDARSVVHCEVSIGCGNETRRAGHTF